MTRSGTCSPGCACTRCSPPTPPRRAAGRWSSRCAASRCWWTPSTTTARAATDHEETLRELREEIDLLWRTSQLRANAMDPIDEVRTVMAAFDETLFRVVPALYRAMDDAAAGADSGSVPTRVPAFLRFGSWVGADRDGNPFVTARVTREAATIQADHVLRALERATTRIGRALTVHASTAPPSPGLRRALEAAAAAHPELLAESRPAPRRSRTGPTCSTWRRARGDP